MKTRVSTEISEHNNYVIATEEGLEKGIFFRSPIQKVVFDGYGNGKFSPYDFIDKIKNPIRRFYEILIGNGKIVKDIPNIIDRIDFGGFRGNILCSPIYFKREYRKLTAESCNNQNIKKIESYGYESEWCICAGECAVEKTTLHLRSGKKIRIKRHNTYQYTYAHVIKKKIDNTINVSNI